jgi:hypothetical protein
VQLVSNIEFVVVSQFEKLFHKAACGGHKEGTMNTKKKYEDVAKIYAILIREEKDHKELPSAIGFTT